MRTRIIAIAATLFALTACGAPPQTASRADAIALPSQTNNVHLPNGHTIQCTAYPGYVCPQS